MPLKRFLHYFFKNNVIYLIFSMKNHYAFIPQTLRVTFLMC